MCVDSEGGGISEVPQHQCGDQRTTCGIPFSPSTVWVSGIKFRSLRFSARHLAEPSCWHEFVASPTIRDT